MSSKIKKYLLDFFLIAILAIISFSISAFLLQGEILSPGYEDWMAHAFRIQILDQYGYTSWIHNWSNGISVWNSYQILPHYITLGIVNLFDVTIPKAMIYITVALFVLLRIIIYVVLRLLNFSKATAFMVSLLSLSIAQYWEGVSDFSLMFAFSFFPLFLYLWIIYYKNKISLLYAYSVGISFYIHPLLGISLFVLWFIGNILSNKAVLSKSNLIEFLIMLLTSSLFWIPLFFGGDYTYKNSYLSSLAFTENVLRRYELFGLNIVILILFAISVFTLFKENANLSWSKVLFIFSTLYLLLIIIGTQFQVPHIIAQTQFSRGVFFVGLSMIFVIASLIELVVKSKLLIIKILTALLVTIAFVDSLWYATIHSPNPQVKQSDPILNVYESNMSDAFTDGRVWSQSIGSSSFYAQSDVKFAYSYMGHLESNQLSHRLGQHLLYANQSQQLTNSSTETVNNYLQLTGTKHLLLEPHSTFTKSFIENNKSNIASVKLVEGNSEDYNYITMNWKSNNAYLLEDVKNFPSFPKEYDIMLSSDQKYLDDLVSKYTDIINKNGKPVNVIYPSNDQVNVEIPSGNRLPYLFVNESYDQQWKAFINDKKVSVSSFGPNFMLVDVRGTNGGTLVLKHTWPVSHYISLFLIFFIGASLLIYRLVEKMSRKDKHEIN